MGDYGFVRGNVERIQAKITAAAERAGRKTQEISLLAVTKFHPREAVTEAYACGIRLFGENRVQEAEEKYGPELRPALDGMRLDMLGTLQRNKINRTLALFDACQSIASLELLSAVIQRASARKLPFKMYLEMHTGEATKSGFPDIDSLCRAVEAYLEYMGSVVPGPMLSLAGLMTMAPFTEDRPLLRASFRKLAAASREIQKRFSLPDFRELSMGMSNDFEIAVEEGATLLRIGTAIFGART